MTTDELKRLAIIAGYRFRDDTPEGQFCLSNTTDGWYLSPGEHDEVGSWSCVACQLDWQPHIRIEQAMMVAEEFTKETCLNFVLESPGNTWLANFYDISVDKYLCGQADTPALAICRAALAAAKEV